MLALRYGRKDGLDGLVLADVPAPAPGPGEVLVDVRAAGVNPVDWKILTGHLRLLVRSGWPRGIGGDFAGTVAALGPGVRGFAVGDRVLGLVDPFRRNHGTIAQQVPVPVASVFALPDGIPMPLAGALPCAGLSATALCDMAEVHAGQRVLVNGAAGGVGHLAVQIARARGATVTAVASGRRRALLAELGADRFIDYTLEPRDRWPGDFDAVLDCVPNLPRRSHGQLLRRGGRYASTLPGPATFLLDPLGNRWGRLRRGALRLWPGAAAMRELLDGVQSGRVRCVVAAEYPLAQARAALEQSMAGGAAGKIVIRVD